MADKFSNFRARTLAEKNTDNKINAEFIDTHASSTYIEHLRVDETIKAVVTRDQKEGVDETILFTHIYPTSEENIAIGDYITHDGITYLVFMEYILPTKLKTVYKKFRIIECNVQIKVDNISQRAAYIGSLKKFVSMTEESAGYISLGVEQYKPVLITKNNTNLVVGVRFLLGTEAFEIIALDRISNAGIMYVSVNAVPFNATTDNLSTGTAITPADAVETSTSLVDDELKEGAEVTISTFNGYVVFNPLVNVVSRTLTSVTFKVPFGITELKVDRKNSSNVVVSTTYQVVV
jgi:hypothetical protein